MSDQNVHSKYDDRKRNKTLTLLHLHYVDEIGGKTSSAVRWFPFKWPHLTSHTQIVQIYYCYKLLSLYVSSAQWTWNLLHNGYKAQNQQHTHTPIMYKITSAILSDIVFYGQNSHWMPHPFLLLHGIGFVRFSFLFFLFVGSTFFCHFTDFLSLFSCIHNSMHFCKETKHFFENETINCHRLNCVYTQFSL